MQAVRFGVGDLLQDKCWKGGLRGIGDFIASSWAGIGYATAGVHSCEGCSMPASHCTTRLGGLRDHVLSATPLNLSLVISKPCGTKSTCHRAGQPLSTLSTQPLPPQRGCVTAMVWRKVCRVAAWVASRYHSATPDVAAPRQFRSFQERVAPLPSGRHRPPHCA